MGRPLYSSTFKTTPAVRDPEPPGCETWSYLNAFDPDSDEFFDNENAVYEDFIDPVTLVTPVNPEEEDEEAEEEAERDIVVRMGNISPITSEGSLSDSDSSLSVDAEDSAHLVADAYHDIRQIEDRASALVAQEPAVRVRLATRASSGEVRWVPQVVDSVNGRSRSRRGFATTIAVPPVSRPPHPQHNASLIVPAPSTPIPVPASPRGPAMADERALLSPSTPPRETPTTYFSMSPPPASTPRLYSWARNSSHLVSPSSNGPFTNPHARTSYAHLSPALIRIRDVAV